MNVINNTHDDSLKSWVTSANENSDFPIQNLPYCIFKRKNTIEQCRGGIGIGKYVIDVQALYNIGVFDNEAGSLLELSHGGQKPIKLSNNESRTFSIDGDELEIRGFVKKGPLQE